MDVYLHPAAINGGVYLAPLAVPVPPAPAPTQDTTPPSAPIGSFVATALYVVHLEWGAASDDTSVAGYEISVDTGTPAWAVIGNVLSADTAISGPGTYITRVRAYDAAGNRSVALVSQVLIGNAVAEPQVTMTVRFNVLPRDFLAKTIHFST